MHSFQYIRYLALAGLIIAAPVCPMGGFFSNCKASITNIFNRQASTKDVGIGLATLSVASLITYGLIKYLMYQRDFANVKSLMADNSDESFDKAMKYAVMGSNQSYESINARLGLAPIPGNPENLERLIQFGKKRKKINQDYLSSLLVKMICCAFPFDLTREQCNIIKILLKHGANINRRQNLLPLPQYCYEVSTPLTDAIRFAKPRMARFLLKQGAEIMIPAAAPGTYTSAYKYIPDEEHELYKPLVIVLDNHRRKLARDSASEISKEFANRLAITSEVPPAGIMAEYAASYPLEEELPLEGLKPVDDGLGPEIDVD